MFVIATTWSCSIEGPVVNADGEFILEILPIESASVPDEVLLGETYTISYSYFKPSTCYLFSDLYYVSENNVRTIAVINKVLNASGNIICETLTNQLEERSFTFVADITDNINDAYIFKFWHGKDNNGQDTFLVFEVPIMQ